MLTFFTKRALISASGNNVFRNVVGLTAKCHNLGHLTPTSDTEVDTIVQVKEKLRQHMGVKEGYTPLLPSRAHLTQYLPSSQDELPPRTMQDSFKSAIIPLSSDSALQDKYVTFLGQVRLGRLMEDMDCFAVWVADNHILNPLKPADSPMPYTLVTVSVDQVNFTDLIPKPDADIRLSGHVSWVGKSSMEIVVWLEQIVHDKWEKITRALFLMAARDSTNTRAAVINKLVPANDKEKEILMGGEVRKKIRQRASEQSLLKTEPDDEEQRVIHDLFMRTLDVRNKSFKASNLPAGSVWMKSTQIDNMIFSHPEDRNMHQKVFGGFLMRQALELSWSCGWVFSKQRPKLTNISHIVFLKPIEVSSLLKMRAEVVFTEMQYIQIMVMAEVYDPQAGNESTTNMFHFTYRIDDLAPKVFPKSYHEAMMYLEGRRHFQYVMGLKKF